MSTLLVQSARCSLSQTGPEIQPTFLVMQALQRRVGDGIERPLASLLLIAAKTTVPPADDNPGSLVVRTDAPRFINTHFDGRNRHLGGVRCGDHRNHLALLCPGQLI